MLYGGVRPQCEPGNAQPRHWGWQWQTPTGWNNYGKGQGSGQHEEDQRWIRWQQTPQQPPDATYGNEDMAKAHLHKCARCDVTGAFAFPSS